MGNESENIVTLSSHMTHWYYFLNDCEQKHLFFNYSLQRSTYLCLSSRRMQADFQFSALNPPNLHRVCCVVACVLFSLEDVERVPSADHFSGRKRHFHRPCFCTCASQLRATVKIGIKNVFLLVLSGSCECFWFPCVPAMYLL